VAHAEPDAFVPLSDAIIAQARQAAGKGGLSAATFRAWLRVRKVAGEKDAEALAAVALQALARHRGDDAAWAFAGACFAADVPNDLRGWIHALLHPVEGRLRKSAGADFESLARWTREELGAP
jgi:hypothetical protein